MHNLNPKNKEVLVIASDQRALARSIQKSLNDVPAEIHNLSLESIRSKLALESPDCLLLIAQDPTTLTKPILEWVKQYDDNLPIVF